jgi:hypothetical protein
MNTRQIETVGSLLKVDNVITIQHDILPNTFVLETIEPYPGYHDSVPSGVKPNLIFLVTAQEYSIENIMRTTSRIQNYTDIHLDATPGSLKIYNDTYHSIRLRGLLTYDQIKQVQNYYLCEGIKFLKKKNIEAPALVHLRKPYLLQEVEEGIFKDVEEPMMWYFAIPARMEWNMLKMMTNSIKNNIENNNFDAAFGWVFVNTLTDIIRIYALNFTLSNIKDLQARYRDEIRKYMKL